MNLNILPNQNPLHNVRTCSVTHTCQLSENLNKLQLEHSTGQGVYSEQEILKFVSDITRTLDCHVTTNAAKQVTLLLGFPGAGKTTQIELLSRALEAPRFHLGKFAEQCVLSEEMRQQVDADRSAGRLIHGLTPAFLEWVATAEDQKIIIDGFPRTPEDAVILATIARRENWDLKLIEIGFTPGREVERSLERQIARHRIKHESEPSESEILRYLQKIKRQIDFSTVAATVLKLSGIPYHLVESDNKNIESINCEIHRFLGTQTTFPTWDKNIVDTVSRAATVARVRNAVISCGAFYRPFWDNKFGPPWNPIDIHVGVDTFEEACRLRIILEKLAPERRFKVQPMKSLLESSYGIAASSRSIEQSLYLIPCIWQQGFVTLQEGEMRVTATEACLTDLRSGILRVDDSTLMQMPEKERNQALTDATSKAAKLKAQYPGLSISGSLGRALRLTGTEPDGKPYKKDYFLNHQAVLNQEQKHGGKSHWSAGVLDQERSHAETVRCLLKSLSPKTEAIPVPAPTILPGILGEMQIAKQAYKDLYSCEESRGLPHYKEPKPAPVGFNTWLNFMALESTDGEWRNWLLDQSKSRTPLGGRDPWLEKILNLNLHQELEKAKLSHPDRLNGAQKETHQGVTLSLHLLWSAIVLDTRSCVESLAEHGLNVRECNEVRAAMRLGMLCHDLGKLCGEAAIYTPGVHEILGAKLWQFMAPSWCSPFILDIGRWCVTYHDLPGRLARGLTEKMEQNTDDINAIPSYQGAYDPSACRQKIKELPLPFDCAILLCREIWRADVGSVPDLRWLLPSADSLIELISGTQENHGGDVLYTAHD